MEHYEQEKRISVIIPVYKAEVFLDDCIASVLKQTYQNLEIILIDDGSPDNSGKICDAYAAKDPRISVIHKKNSGVSDTRNVGLKKATGEGIVFLDSDDMLADSNALAAMMEQLGQTESDIVVANYARLWKKKILPAGNCMSLQSLNRESQDFRFQGFYSNGILAYVWGKLYRRSFLEKYQICFQWHGYAEDKAFNLECYFCGAKYCFCETRLNLYRMNPDSTSFRYRQDSLEQWIALTEEIDQTLKQKYADKQKDYQDVVWYTVLFAAFFNAKEEYIHTKRSTSAVHALLKQYRKAPLAVQAFRKTAQGHTTKGLSQLLWKIVLRGFSAAMYLHLLWGLSLGIKLLVDFRIDEKLSDTGMRE